MLLSIEFPLFAYRQTLALAEFLDYTSKIIFELDIVVAELNQIKKERQEKEIRKQARANHKRLPKRDRMTPEILKKCL